MKNQPLGIGRRKVPENPIAMLTGAPHRILFLGGALQALASIGWWLADLLGRYANWYEPLHWSLPPSWMHPYLLAYGLFPFFMFGFLLTAVPNWLGVRPRRYGWVSAAVLMCAGLLLTYIGLPTKAWLAAAGVAVHLAGFGIAWAELLRLVLRSPARDKRYPRLLATEVGMGWLGAFAFLLYVITDDAGFAEFSRRAGVWFFLLPVFFTVSHRMVPFFSSRVLEPYEIYRPQWSLWLILTASVAHGAIELGGGHRFSWIVDAPMCATLFFLAFKWGLMRCFAARLLAVLHLSLLGAAISTLLYSIQSLLLFFFEMETLGSAPVHAMTLGYFSAMMVAMVSRVSLGHSGHALIADNLTWIAFWGMMATAMVRVLAEAPFVASHAFAALIPLAAFMWFGFFLLWASRYLPLYVNPPTDAEPG